MYIGKPVETIAVTSTTVSTAVGANCNRIDGLVVNRDTTNSIQISFTDATANTTFFTLIAGGVISLAGNQSAIYAKAVAGTPSLYICEIVG